MVRPCMVAILVLLTVDRRSSGHSDLPAGATATDPSNAAANITEIASVKCNYKGRSYEPGSSVNTDQPCLKCTCVTGNLVCHLQVCSELPDPPPQGCLIVHKKNKCCAQLQCFYEQYDGVQSNRFSLQTESRSGPARMENSAVVTFDGIPKGCVVNGTIYAEGSAMDSSSLCEYCYCIKGRQQCVRPQCSLTIPGCTAVYKKHTCCPIKYKCSLLQNTTDAPTTEVSSLSARLKDCRINGRLISLGEPVIGVARSSCETCFCINGQVRCDKVICPPIRAQIAPNCGPVYSEGHCCPTSYNCTGNSNNESHVGPTIRIVTTTTIETTETTSTITAPSTTVVNDDNVSLDNSSSPSPPPSITTPTTTMDAPNDSASDTMHPNNNNNSTMEDPMESRHANIPGLFLDEYGNLNVSKKSNNFEMDYEEPTLPPSLPNLKIIPFVAADAVVDEPAKVYDSYQPEVEHVYNVSEIVESPTPDINIFSPPIETEGGFVPKDPPDGTLYVPDKYRTTTERVSVQTTVHFDELVVGHQPPGSVWCVSNGKKYKHGELLTEPSACNICVCFNANIVCQENCPAVKVGCQRINDSKNNTCCGRIVCNDSENDITTTEQPKLSEVTSEVTTTTTKIRDLVVEHIVYSAPSTDEPFVTTSAPTTVKLTTFSEPTTPKPITTTTMKLSMTSAPTTTSSAIPSTSSAPIKRMEIKTTEEPAAKPLEDEDYSFESMFSFLFNGDTVPEQPPSTPVNNIASETRIEHRADEEIDTKSSQTDSSMSLTELLFETNLNSNKEQHANIKNHPTTKPNSEKKQHTEDKVESQTTSKSTTTKPNSVVNLKTNAAAVSFESNSEIKQHVTTKPSRLENKQPVDHKQHVEIKPHLEYKPSHSGIKQQTEVKTHVDVGTKSQVTLQMNLKHHGMEKPYIDSNKPQTDVKGTKVEVKPHTDLKFQSETKIDSGFKHQADVKTHFDVKDDKVDFKPYFDFKHHQQTEEKQHSDFKQHTEVKSNYGITKPLKTKTDTSEFGSLQASMLKISGCNIYGRMYRVGKIIAELSTPCLECMCTEIGVHCNQLKC